MCAGLGHCSTADSMSDSSEMSCRSLATAAASTGLPPRLERVPERGPAAKAGVGCQATPHHPGLLPILILKVHALLLVVTLSASGLEAKLCRG